MFFVIQIPFRHCESSIAIFTFAEKEWETEIMEYEPFKVQMIYIGYCSKVRCSKSHTRVKCHVYATQTRKMSRLHLHSTKGFWCISISLSHPVKYHIPPVKCHYVRLCFCRAASSHCSGATTHSSSTPPSIPRAYWTLWTEPRSTFNH